MEKLKKRRLHSYFKLLVALFALCSISEMMAMKRAYHLPIQSRTKAITSNAQREKTFDLSANNQLALLRELCAVDSADISGETNRLSVEIQNFSLEQLVNLRNFTAEQGFSKSGDLCYIRIDQLMDARLLRKSKDWLKKLMKDYFFSRNDYQEFERLNVSVGEKILKTIWNDQDTRNELLRVAGSHPNPFNNRIGYIEGLSKGNDLGRFLDGVKKVYVDAWYTIHDEESLKRVQELEQNRKLKEEKAKKWFLQRWWGW